MAYQEKDCYDGLAGKEQTAVFLHYWRGTASSARPRRRIPRGLRRTDPRSVEEDVSLGAPDTLLRTKRLLLAALRVWELRNGIRSYW
jgi:hypothetical protein